jgi:uncharacterized protein (TIGR02246 family)
MPSCLFLAALVSIGLGPSVRSVRAQNAPRPKNQTTEPDPRRDDRAAIGAAMQSFVKAFGSGDAKLVAGHWTSEGEYESDEVGTIRGREALERAFSGFFTKSPKAKAELDDETIRFLSRDGAIDEGAVTIRRDSAQGPMSARYRATFLREDGRWRIAHLREWPVEDSSLNELAWLVGNWKSTGGGAEIQSTYSWDEHKKFLHVHFSIKEKDRTLAGFQVLGKDPATGQIKSWNFEAEGGVGAGTWNRDGDHWVIELEGALADGKQLTSTNVLRRINDDMFTWQSINRMLDDSEIPDLPPVKITRIKASK